MCSLVTATLCFLVLLSSTAYSNGAGYYVMLVPTVIYEHSSVSIGVSTVGYEKDEQFQVKLQKNDDNRIYDVATTDIRQRNAAKRVDMIVPALENIPYQFTIHGPGKIVESIKVATSEHPLILLIQTDKPLYKPGDTVKFRVLVVDHLTRPIKNLEKINVQLKDSNNNLIRKWSEVKLHQGVFQSHIDLANFIPLGEWTLKVKLKDVQETKTFNVDEYVLPLHEINIGTSKRVLMRDETLELIIDAKYTFGKPIRGVISLAFDGVHHPDEYEINGRSIVSIPMKDVVDVNGINHDVYRLEVDVNITESVSEQVYTAREAIQIHERSHKIWLNKSAEYLLNEESVYFWIMVTDPDGVPLTNPGPMNISVLTVPLNWHDNYYQYFERKPDDEGVIELRVRSTRSTDRIELEVTYEGEQHKFKVLRENHPDDIQPAFFKASLLVRKPILNRLVDILVQSSFRLEEVMCYVISQGQILSSGNVTVQKDPKKIKRTANFSFLATFPMVPEASVLVFTIHEGMLWTDVIRFKVRDLNNQVDVEISSNRTEPRSRIGLKVKTKLGSVVGLLAVDRSLLQLGTGNDITQQLVLEKLGNQRIDETIDLETLKFEILTNAQRQVRSSFEALQTEVGISPRIGDFDEKFMLSAMRRGSPNIVRVRKNFPETWLWTDMAQVDDDGNLKLEYIVPDTITGWSISAIAINAAHGLGVIKSPVSLAVLKSFFITVNLPYSVVKTETATVEVFVHNYLDQYQYVTVRVQNEFENFQFVDENGAVKSTLEDSKMVTVAKNSVQKVTFMLKPTQTGNPIITVLAGSDTVTDAVQRNLRVTPGGLQYFDNMPEYIEVDNSLVSYKPFHLAIPRTATNGSVSITLSVEGFLLGAALSNLDQIIRLPSGCGEQNLLNLVPSVIALEYMASTDILTDAVKAKAIGYLEKGYQNQLNYMLQDGSFSVFGEFDGRGSVFLTALVAKIFNFAKKHVFVENSVIVKAFNWLKKKQSADGRFTESGRLFYKALQSDLQDGITLTAYVLIAFLEHEEHAKKFSDVVKKGTEYIAKQKDVNGSPYQLALVAYVFQLAGHPKSKYFFDKLMAMSKSNDDSSLRWWDNGSTSIETTAYALLTYMSNGSYVDAKPLMKWLVSQRYDKGGYDNTQNTFVGLQALAQYSRQMSVKKQNYDVLVSYDNVSHRLHMDSKSTINGGHKLAIPPHVRNIDVKVEGTGGGVLQIAYQYNKVAYDNKPRFKIEKTLKKAANDRIVRMHICAGYEPERLIEVTNMVLMEVLFPSGYVVANNLIQHLRENKEVRKAETENSDTRLILYFDPLQKDKNVCVDVEASRRAIVLNQAPGWIKLYDYYDPTREAIEYFDFIED
ncbi:thioester-containing protein 1 allele S3 [Aedes albopictus]|uniref:Alpha-macroglobulin n=1 Tax=Aedes albopictus TaxID=7160 RepID=A0ABM1ZJJ9_AEDAL